VARSIATAIGSGIFAFAIALMFAGIMSRLETSGEGVGAARAREGEGEGSARVRMEVKRILAVGQKRGVFAAGVRRNFMAALRGFLICRRY
jgi:hypothetical protein